MMQVPDLELRNPQAYHIHISTLSVMYWHSSRPVIPKVWKRKKIAYEKYVRWSKRLHYDNGTWNFNYVDHNWTLRWQDWHVSSFVMSLYWGLQESSLEPERLCFECNSWKYVFQWKCWVWEYHIGFRKWHHISTWSFLGTINNQKTSNTGIKVLNFLRVNCSFSVTQFLSLLLISI